MRSRDLQQNSYLSAKCSGYIAIEKVSCFWNQKKTYLGFNFEVNDMRGFLWENIWRTKAGTHR